MDHTSDIGRTVAELPADVRDRLRRRVTGGQAKQVASGNGIGVGPASRAPLSNAQERLWFIEQLEHGSVHHNDGLLLLIRGELDESALRGAIDEIIERHQVLRSAFVAGDDGHEQVVRAARPLELPEIRLTGAELTAHDPVLLAAFRQEMERPFDLAEGQLVRAVLYRLGEQRAVLGVTIHHLVCDLWSFAIFARELAALYPARLAGGAAVDLPALPLQYADYAVQQRAAVDQDRIAVDLGRRTDALRGAPALLPLPTVGPRPAVQQFIGSVERFTVSRAVADQLRTCAQDEQATLYMVLLAAFNVLLARTSGSADIVVAAPTATRDRPELERLIGCFLNMILIRTDCSGDPSFATLVGRVRQACLDAYQDRDLPYEKLITALAPQRTRSYQPVAQVAFALQNIPDEKLVLPGLEVEFHKADTGRARMDISVWITESEDGLAGEIEYDRALFSTPQVHRIARQFECLLAAVATDSQRPIGELPLVDSPDRALIIDGWNDTETPIAVAAAHEQVVCQAALRPDAVAVVTDDEQISYADLDRRSSALAGLLVAAGIAPEQPVAVCLPRSVREVVTVLAVFKAGAVYVPLDPNSSPERRDEQLAQVGVSVVISAGTLADESWHPGRRVIDLDDEPEPAGEDPAVTVRPDNLAYIILTSGSTGRPKAVGVTHQGFANRMFFGQLNYPLDGSHRVLRKAAPTFDVSLDELFRALMFGAASVQAPDTPGFDPRRLAARISRHSVTDADFAPTMLRELLNTVGPADLRSLRRVVSGVEALPAETAALILQQLDVSLFNLYGPTEVSVSCTSWPVTDPAERRTVPIGRPMSNVQVYVVDRDGRLAPPGAIGELWVGGAGLARGYLGQPGQTAAAFVPDPFSGRPGARLYRTGDLVRWTFAEQTDQGDERYPAPALEFVGRADRQLNIRGIRIEPGHVEAVLRGVPNVADAVVVVDDHQRLVGYLVGEDLPGAAELRTMLRSRLADQMIPALYVPIESIPYTAHGKVDFAALPAPVAGPQTESVVDERARTRAEQVLTAVWCDVLEREQIGLDESFFDLGGDSMAATRILARACSELDADIEVSAIFDSPTIAELATRFDR